MRRAVPFAALLSVATWVACTVGQPVVRTATAPQPRPADTAAAGEAGYPEGLLDLGATGVAGEAGGVPGLVGELAAGAASAAIPPLPGEGERAAGAEALRRGLAAARAGNTAAAVQEYERAAAQMPAFADWSTLLAARALASSARADEVRRTVERIGGAAAGEWSWRPLHDALLAGRDSAGAMTVAEQASQSAGTAAERAFAASRAGALRVARGDLAGGIDAYRRAMRESPSSVGGLEGARGAHDLPGLTAGDRLLIGRTLLAHGGTDRGIPMLEAYANAPGTAPAERTEVLLEAGRILFNARRYEPAERHLRAASASSAEAAFLLARTQYRLGRQAEGVQSFLAVPRSHPGSPAAADALFLLGDLAHDSGRTSEAAAYYRQAVATGAHNASATDAAVRLAGIALLAGDADGAIRDLERYFEQRSRDRISTPALYWLGRGRAARGDSAAATDLFRVVQELDPFSYYGMLAAKRLGTALAAVALPAPPSIPADRAAAIEFAFFRMDLLREIGLAEDADLELARLQETFESDHAALYSVAEAMTRHGQPIAGALLGRRIQQARGVWDERLLRIVFPFPFQDLVVRESRRQALDPYAVAGLIRQESLFNPIAVSPAGAVGLMQVMPQTGAGLARRAGISAFQPSMLREPATNLRLGTLYLADQMARWNGRLSDVLGAYNAGPNRVARWRELPEHRDDEIYVERIPIAETRDYVKRVTLNGEIYRRLYGGI